MGVYIGKMYVRTKAWGSCRYCPAAHSAFGLAWWMACRTVVLHDFLGLPPSHMTLLAADLGGAGCMHA